MTVAGCSLCHKHKSAGRRSGLDLSRAMAGLLAATNTVRASLCEKAASSGSGEGIAPVGRRSHCACLTGKKVASCSIGSGGLPELAAPELQTAATTRLAAATTDGSAQTSAFLWPRISAARNLTSESSAALRQRRAHRKWGSLVRCPFAPPRATVAMLAVAAAVAKFAAVGQIRLLSSNKYYEFDSQQHCYSQPSVSRLPHYLKPIDRRRFVGVRNLIKSARNCPKLGTGSPIGTSSTSFPPSWTCRP